MCEKQEEKCEQTLFEQLGGAGAVDAAVDKFYVKVLSDDRIKHFFEGVNMDRQREMQKRFLTYAFGGPQTYNGRCMRTAHKKVCESGLNNSHFDAVIEDLGSTLKELGVSDELNKRVAETAGTLRADVLNL